MAKVGVVKFSTLGAVPHAAWNPGFLLRVKDRLDARSVEETPANVKAEVSMMEAEAMERMRHARSLQDQANKLAEQARREREEAEILTNMKQSSLARRM